MPADGRSRAFAAAAFCLLAGPGVLVGCGGSGLGPSTVSPNPQPASSVVEPSPPALMNGKADERVKAGTYLAPAGFEPGLRLDVPAGWTSVHRYPDAFDLGQPDPERDAPLLAVVFMRPPESSAEAALAGVRRRATGQVTNVRGDLTGSAARGLDVSGGRGPLIVSADEGIALDADPGQRARVLATDVAGKPLVVVVLVPDGRRWDELWPLAEDLLAGVTPS
jgi:hypothetical protein